MFWGLIMEPQKRYSQVIKKAFHISMASLDVSNSDDQPAQILCGYEGKNYLLCTLQKPDKLQCNLDLYFEEGHSVSFASNGKSLVHLTGYLTKDMLDDESDDQEFDVQAKKKSRKAEKSSKEPTSKKIKLDHLFKDINDEDESDDSEFDINQVLNEECEEESGEEEETADEDMEDEDESMSEDDAEEDTDDEEGEDEEEGEEEEEEEDEVVEEKVAQNGLSKKSKQIKGEQLSTPTKKTKQPKEKPQLTPGPKSKKQEKSDSENSLGKKGKSKEEKKSQEGQSPVQKKRTLSNGIIVEDLRLGQGDAATNGKFIHVYYEGRLKSNNKVFDKSLNGPGFGFRLGKGEVIKGWDIGVNGMRVGGKRRIICPPQVAYGAKGSPPVIPPNSTLVFEVEVKKVK